MLRTREVGGLAHQDPCVAFVRRLRHTAITTVRAGTVRPGARERSSPSLTRGTRACRTRSSRGPRGPRRPPHQFRSAFGCYLRPFWRSAWVLALVSGLEQAVALTFPLRRVGDVVPSFTGGAVRLFDSFLSSKQGARRWFSLSTSAAGWTLRAAHCCAVCVPHYYRDVARVLLQTLAGRCGGSFSPLHSCRDVFLESERNIGPAEAPLEGTA